MEAYLKDSSKAKGIELLYFERAEVEKFKDNSSVFAGTGPLSVLYFEDYNRFVLQINDWRYPLVRRLPILSEGKTDSPTYLLPTQNGFYYRLTLDSQQCKGTKNFEAILENNSRYSIKGQETPLRELEASPEDGLLRHSKKEAGPKEVITQNLKQAGEGLNTLMKNLKTGVKHLTSSKKSVNLKDIKTKDFKKEAHSTFKKEFFQKSEKKSQNFLQLRKDNVNQTEINEYHDLRTNHQPIHYIVSEEIEDLILNNKELAANGNVDLSQFKSSQMEKKEGMINEVRRSTQDSTAPRGRDRNIQDTKEKIETKLEGMVHYQG